jgi:histidinol-phosphate aminotransferase
MNRYPDGAGFYLKQAIAKSIGVTPEEILIGNGSDEIVQLLAAAYLNPQRGMVTSEYSFVRYRMRPELADAPCKLVKMKNFAHDPPR